MIKETDSTVLVQLYGVTWIHCNNPAVDFNIFEIYYMHVLRPPNIETLERQLKIIADKYQDKDKFIFNDAISYVK